jgi:hypothetical protein
VAAGGLLLGPMAQAGSANFCDAPPRLNPRQQDQLLSFSAFVREQLQASGAQAALVARDGLDLAWLGRRYSHAGLALRDNPEGPWAVRQLYFACEDARPRLFDQGLAGFLMGSQHSDRGFIRLLVPPPEAAQALAETSLSNARALSFLHNRYSGNAYPFSTEYQNCNQWVAELMASAWGGAPDRAAAQRWLAEQGFVPDRIEVPWWPLLWLSRLNPWLHLDDHPREELTQARLHLTLPDSVAEWLRHHQRGTQRFEFCRNERQMVMRLNGPLFGEVCEPAEGDVVRPLD